MACTMRAPDGLRPPGPRNRAFHDARKSLRRIARPRRGVFVPRESPAFAFASCGDQPLTLLSRPPRWARMRCLPRYEPAKVAKIASTPSTVTRPRLSRPRVPSLGKQPVTPHDHFRSPIPDRRRPRDFAGRASDSRLLFTHTIPRSACWRFEATSGRDCRDARMATCALSRGLSDVG